jgi:hypothetical protein
MPIMLPLTLIGFGYLIYQLFAGATWALPIALGVAAAFGASQLGCSPFMAFILGLAAFMAVITASQLAALKLTNPYARIGLVILFAVPAALTGFSFAHALGVMVGTSGIVSGLIAAAACAAISAHRLMRLAL